MLFHVQIRKPLSSKYVYIRDEKGKTLDKIDVLSANVKTEGNKFTLNGNFRWNFKYAMVFEEGITKFCVVYLAIICLTFFSLTYACNNYVITTLYTC